MNVGPASCLSGGGLITWPESTDCRRSSHESVDSGLGGFLATMIHVRVVALTSPLPRWAG